MMGDAECSRDRGADAESAGVADWPEADQDSADQVARACDRADELNAHAERLIRENAAGHPPAIVELRLELIATRVMLNGQVRLVDRITQSSALQAEVIQQLLRNQQLMTERLDELSEGRDEGESWKLGPPADE